jgi:hypothetical protein
MRWSMIAMVVLVGCSKKTPDVPAAIVNAVAKPPADAVSAIAPLVHRAATPDAAWAHLEKPPIETKPLFGPYKTLDALCADIKAPTQCEFGKEAVGGPFLEIALAKVELPDTGAENEDPVTGAREHVAIRTAAGWFAMPHVADVGNQSGWTASAKRVDQRLVLEYEYEARTHGRWAEDYENGVIVCAVTSQSAVACTDQIPTVSFSTDTASRDDPQGVTTAKLACHAELEADHLIISEGAGKDIPKPKPPACAGLTYGGDHPITFPTD